MTADRRIAFVPPRYGDEVIGGAEAVFKEAAHGLAERGWAVEILTTCARDHYTWRNEYPAGVEVDGAVTIRRFPAVISTPRIERHQLGERILSGARLSITEQQRWMNDDLRSPELYHYLLAESRRYQTILFAPYMFWTTYACAQIAPERTIVMPCLHDEPFAYLEIYEPVISGAAAVWFLTEPERSLAQRLFRVPARSRVVGAGIPVPVGYRPDSFRSRNLIEGPFVLFAGRREGGKGWEEMLSAFDRSVARRQLDLSLVTMGVGEVDPPPSLSGRFYDLGRVSDEVRNDAFAAAAAYIQPSSNESFSRTVMEAWLAGSLVIANGASDVVKWHCERSGAGLTFDDEFEFEECLTFVDRFPEKASALAKGGRDYVLKNYTWSRVLDAMEETLEDWF